jgi:hypothetical protein
MNGKERGSLYLLTGLVIGLAFGLLYAWVIQPVRTAKTTPATLKPADKERYRSLIAAAYVANGDLLRAKARLELLKDPDPYNALAEQARRALDEDADSREARALGLLVVAIGQESGNAPIFPLVSTQTLISPTQIGRSEPSNTGTPQATQSTRARSKPASILTASPVATRTRAALTSPQVTTTTVETPALTADTTITQPPPSDTPQPTPTSTRTFTPTPRPTTVILPTRTNTPTPGAPFVLENQERVCDQVLSEPLLQVQVTDAQGQPVPGVEIVVSWPGGEEHFYTGLKPELGLGYADYTISPDETYALRLAEGGQTVSGLSAVDCEASNGERYWGAWLLTFSEP